MGSAVNQTCRQVGGALGIAVVVALLGTSPAGQVKLDTFRHLWTYSASMAACTGLISVLLRPKVSTEPAKPSRDASGELVPALRPAGAIRSPGPLCPST